MLISKKKIIVCLVAILIAISTYSYGTTNGVITGETVKLRESASLEAKLVMLLSVNDKVEVLGQEGDWYKVNYKDNAGYVYKDYIKVENIENANSTIENTTQNNKQQVDNNTTEAESNENNNTESVTNNSEDITVPSEKVLVQDSKITILPLINSSSVANILKDTKVTVTEYKNGWAYIISTNASGWIRKENLKDLSEIVTTPETTENNNETEDNNASNETEKDTDMINKKMYVNVSSVRVRKESNTSSEVVDSLVLNNQVIIIGEENDWYKIKVNGQEGYIVKKYLSLQEVQATNRSLSVERTEKTEETEVKAENTVSSSNNSNSTSGSSIVEYAKTFLGSKYVSGGTSPSSGFDCSGLTYYVYKHFGYTLNRSSSGQENNGKEVSKSELQLGDLVLFSQGSKRIGHVGIYIGGNSFIHAANPSKGVVITSLSNSYYKERYVTARRILN